MTLCRSIVTRAFRALGVLGEAQEATGSKGLDGLQHFQDMINDLPGLRKGDWAGVTLTSAAAYEAADGERINTAGYAAVITLPTTYVDDDGTTQEQRDMSRVQIMGAAHDQAGLWLYSASTGAWAQADALALGDDHPFGPEDDAGLVAMLAVDLNSEFGEPGAVPAVTMARAERQLRSFRARFRRATATAVDDMLLAMSNTGDHTARNIGP